LCGNSADKEKTMLCIDVTTTKDGYTQIRVTDKTGFYYSLGGFDRWPFIRLEQEENILI
jgi:hypothetical protein